MMRRKIISVILIGSIIVGFLSAGTVDKIYGGLGFSMFFHKPTNDEFDFCSPEDPSTPFAGGIVFPLPNGNDASLMTKASIGVVYVLESNCSLMVWFNANERHNDVDFRLRREALAGENVGKGLNGVIGIGPDIAAAENAADVTGLNSALSINKNETNNASIPIVTVDYDMTTQKQTVTFGAVDSVHGVGVGPGKSSGPGGQKPGSGSFVISMKITVPLDEGGSYRNAYDPGQYKGYVTMMYVPKV